MALTPGETIELKNVTQDQEIIVGGVTITESSVVIGEIIHACSVINATEYIRLQIKGRVSPASYKWNDSIVNYDPLTVSDDPALEPRWVAE